MVVVILWRLCNMMAKVLSVLRDGFMRDVPSLSSTRKCLASLFLVVLMTACTPTVQVAVPDKPIEINLNVKIEHEIKIKVDKELDVMFEEDSGLF